MNFPNLVNYSMTESRNFLSFGIIILLKVIMYLS